MHVNTAEVATANNLSNNVSAMTFVEVAFDRCHCIRCVAAVIQSLCIEYAQQFIVGGSGILDIPPQWEAALHVLVFPHAMPRIDDCRWITCN